MPDLAFDLRHLKYAMLVAEHGSFGLTLTSESALGTSYSDVTFIPLNTPAEAVEFSVLWRTTNENPALRILLKLCAA
ncbi:MAG TPA: hypothetical protein VF503_31185 [Sphingobium sp.]|uniref:hypothetical protein n=1 Tax=Sphingobium sp. TaxID=1912891 RepID=UPI002ED03B40